MCKAKEYSQQLLDIYNNINNEYQNLYDELNQANLREIDLLHMVENNNFNASEGWKYAKMIRDNRLHRRKIKNELNPLSELKNNFIDKNMIALNEVNQEVTRRNNILKDLTENKIYTPRVLNKPVSNNSVDNPTKDSDEINSTIINITDKHNLNVATYKKTGEKIYILNKVDNDLYYCKMTKSKRKQLINLKNINGLDKIQLA